MIAESEINMKLNHIYFCRRYEKNVAEIPMKLMAYAYFSISNFIIQLPLFSNPLMKLKLGSTGRSLIGSRFSLKNQKIRESSGLSSCKFSSCLAPHYDGNNQPSDIPFTKAAFWICVFNLMLKNHDARSRGGTEKRKSLGDLLDLDVPIEPFRYYLQPLLRGNQMRFGGPTRLDCGCSIINHLWATCAISTYDNGQPSSEFGRGSE